MYSFQHRCIILFAALALVLAMPAQAADAKDAKKTEKAAAAPAAKEAPKDANEIIARGWGLRCAAPEQQKNEKGEKVEVKVDKKTCEAFQRLDMKSNKARLAEFAIGFPDDKDLGKGDARGVVVLPLGVLLEQGVAMKVDDKKPLNFKVRYCTNDGCFSFVTLGKDILDDMKTGKTVTFVFKALTGQDVNLIMGLEGIDKSLKELQP